jgi:hypothetical protein
MADTAAPSEDLEKGIPNVTIVQTATDDGAPDPETRLDVSSDSSRRLREDLLFNPGPRRHHKWKSPLLMLVFYICGLGMSIGHCTFYAKLNNSIVGGPHQQGTNLRFGTAAAFLSQISLSASTWQCYTQWLWRSMGKTSMSIQTLNDVFGADTSVLSFLNLEMLQKFKVGYFMALFAW